MKPPYKHGLNTFARDLRRNAARQENHPWHDFLRTYPVRFRRQRPIDSFIADFYCEEAKLVIELDGSRHHEEPGIAYDAERTAILERCGLDVLRFSNYIGRHFPGVCERIDDAVKKRMEQL